MSTGARPLNRLASEASPYLQQHADNPVDWYPWGEEALERARREDKPLLVSIGYAACHWCHVMAHESFADPEIAAIQNEYFINIKVDREERPDLDSIYMAAAQALTGRGGWPLNVFCLPDGTPFFAGTYFPPDAKANRYRMPSWRQVLLSIAEAYRTRRDDLTASAQELLNHIKLLAQPLPETATVDEALLMEAAAKLEREFDPQYGGFGDAPKFPQPLVLEFLLRTHLRGQVQALPMLHQTLEQMAHGGMYDQVGGGFHRYSVDTRWLVPHFEKMLYDNALLAEVYHLAALVTGDPFLAQIADETFAYLLRDLRHPEGAFFSSEDADSLPVPGAAHAEEGAFYVWTPDELRLALGDDATIVGAYYGVTRQGNFEGKSILYVPRSASAVAARLGVPVERVTETVERARPILRAFREQRPRPFRDEKIITAWNALAIRALATASARVPEYLSAARQCADFLLANLRRADGRLLRSWKDGRPGPAGFLDDYALLCDALLELHAAGGETYYLATAIELAEAMLDLFWDAQSWMFFDTGRDQPALVTRPRDLSDNATPSGTSAATMALLRLYALTGNDLFATRAEQVLQQVAPMLIRFPLGFGRMLCAADLMIGPIRELAIIGPSDHPATQALLAVARSAYRPRLVIAHAEPGDPITEQVALLAGRTLIDGQPTAYLCERFACRLPVTTPEALLEQLG
ncbi:MAG: thioredoxin domain-containing protein [Chloroflexus sp.]|uniref:thioredoxin domain-containing protein n=1 Tax=Chloroflexus sp. TaxID=1904827 RepID=UPI0021DC9A0C|nr:thioredoxin domain-containing protein [Chloroflexus sp.]GIV88531.1 MAG: thioredoxin domain-containing protein [Chloroflexus sp.]